MQISAEGISPPSSHLNCALGCKNRNGAEVLSVVDIDAQEFVTCNAQVQDSAELAVSTSREQLCTWNEL